MTDIICFFFIKNAFIARTHVFLIQYLENFGFHGVFLNLRRAVKIKHQVLICRTEHT